MYLEIDLSRSNKYLYRYLKNLITITLAILVFLQPLSKLYIYVSFKANQDKIAATLCVKKNSKNNHCKGQCVLMKKLAKAEKEEQKRGTNNVKDKYEVVYCQQLIPIKIDFTNKLFFLANNTSPKHLSDLYISTFLDIIFTPPQLV